MTTYAKEIESPKKEDWTFILQDLDFSQNKNFDLGWREIYRVTDRFVEELKKRKLFADFVLESLGIVDEDEENMAGYLKEEYLSDVAKTRGTYFIDDYGDKIYFYLYSSDKPILSANPKFSKLVDQKVARIIDDKDDGKTYLVAQDDKSRRILYNIYNDEDN